MHLTLALSYTGQVKIVGPMRSCRIPALSNTLFMCQGVVAHAEQLSCTLVVSETVQAMIQPRQVFTAHVLQERHTRTPGLLYASCFERSNMYLTFSSGVPTVTPYPRFRIWPRSPAFATQSRTAASMAASFANRTTGSTLPCEQQLGALLLPQNHTLSRTAGPYRTCTEMPGPRRARASAMSTVQSKPTTSTPVAPKRSTRPPLPIAYNVSGTSGRSAFALRTMRAMYGRDQRSQSCATQLVAPCRPSKEMTLTSYA